MGHMLNDKNFEFKPVVTNLGGGRGDTLGGVPYFLSVLDLHKF
jgi:hypothetical protein